MFMKVSSFLLDDDFIEMVQFAVAKDLVIDV